MTLTADPVGTITKDDIQPPCEKHPMRPARFVLRISGCGCVWLFCGPCKQVCVRAHDAVEAIGTRWLCKKCLRYNIGQPTGSVTRL